MGSPSFGGNSEALIAPITGTAPMPGNRVTNVSKAAKLAAQAAKEDKVLRVSKNVKTAAKYGKGFVQNDARAVNSGQSRVQNSQIRLAMEQMNDASYMPDYYRQYNRLQTKLAKASNPEVQTRIKKEIRDLAKKFIEEGYLH